MVLHFISRTQYRQRKEVDFLKTLKEQFGNCYILPEGGTNPLALEGCAEVALEIHQQLSTSPDYICVGCGTGGTMAGIIKGVSPPTQVLGIASLKGNFLTKEVSNLLVDHPVSKKIQWSINTNYHFGGYAKFTPELITFINSFKQQYNIALDPIYTGKMMYAILDLIEKGFFPKESNIVAIHTGGLQGIKGFNQLHGNLLK